MLLAGGLALGLLVHYFGGPPDIIPVAPEKLNKITGAIVDPQTMTKSDQQGVLDTMSNVSVNLRNSVIRAATLKSIDELRRNFTGLNTKEAKQRKVKEIMMDIERNYPINETTRKIFTPQFVGTAMAVYMKEVSAEERALYDPIIHIFIQKMNANK